MALRRCFRTSILSTKDFLSLSDKAIKLYFYLIANSDDDGFVGNCSTVLLISKTERQELDELIKANYLIPFNDELVVITHWWSHNRKRDNRYNPTIYQTQFKQLALTEDGQEMYYLSSQNVDTNNTDTLSLPKQDNINKNNLIQNKETQENLREHKLKPTPENIRAFCSQCNIPINCDDKAILEIVKSYGENWQSRLLEMYHIE